MREAAASEPSRFPAVLHVVFEIHDLEGQEFYLFYLLAPGQESLCFLDSGVQLSVHRLTVLGLGYKYREFHGSWLLHGFDGT